MIELTLSSSGDLSSAFTAAVSGRAIDLTADGSDDEVHPFTAVAGAWRKVSRSATSLLTELRAAEAWVIARESPEAGPLQAALKALLYDATEVFDLYHQTIPKRLERRRSKAEVRSIRDYQAACKRLRDPVALKCNKLKHDHRELGSCLIVSGESGLSTWVFRITAVYGDLQTADRDVHREARREGRFISYERALHEIIHGLLRTDYNAGALIERLSDDTKEPVGLRGAAPLGLANLLADIGARSPVCSASEPGRIPGVRIHGGLVRLCTLETVQVPEPTERMMPARVDEVARNIDMFL